MFKKTISLALVLAMLAGCASEANIQRLGQLRTACGIGNQQACQLVPIQEKINQDEANSNVAKTIGGIALGVLLVGAAAASAASTPEYCYWNRWGHYVCY
jgi:hypothetical protein